MRPLVKICGLTRLEDARHAIAAGVDAVGFVFAPSPRRLSVDDAAAIAGTVGDRVRKVGVFVDAAAEEIALAVDHCGLDVVQLHGGESLDGARRLRSALPPSIGLWRALRFATPEELARLGEAVAAWAALERVSAILLEPMAPLRAHFDWTSLSPLVRRFARPDLPFLVAGGLTAESVGPALLASGAQGADVASGVESHPGHKDPRRILAFIAACRAARPAAEELVR